MAATIAILEDNQGRIQAMEQCLNDSFPAWEHIFFNNAPEAIAWFKEHLHQCILISLDHDLGPSWERNGQPFDPGIGRDVVDYLVTQKPQCPVILHTANSEAEIGMEMALVAAHWTVERVIPISPLDAPENGAWIHNEWAGAIAKLLKSTVNKLKRKGSHALEANGDIPPPPTPPCSRMIIVLDDSSHCEEIIRAQLREVFPAWSSVCFKDSIELMAWLSSNTPRFSRLNRAKTIVVLEDNSKRLELMRLHIDELFPDWSSVFFDTAPDAIAWLSDNLAKCDLISLDYNLGTSWTRKEKFFDPGTGKDVVDYLATQSPQCPIIFHTSRRQAEISMEMSLIDTDWIFDRVCHHNDLKWIETRWIELVKLLLHPIANQELTLADIPFSMARWRLLNLFALTFDGYRVWESPQACIEVGDRCAEKYFRKGILPSSLTELRTALLVARNYWRHYDSEPDEETMVFLRAIVECIREKVRAGEID